MTIRDLINAYYKAVNARDWAAWLALFDDDVVGDEQLGGHFDGVDALRGAVEAIETGYGRFEMHPIHIVAGASSACVIWRCEAVNARGEPIAYPADGSGAALRPVVGANYFRSRGGRIVYMRTIHDSAPFAPFLALVGAAT